MHQRLLWAGLIRCGREGLINLKTEIGSELDTQGLRQQGDATKRRRQTSSAQDQRSVIG